MAGDFLKHAIAVNCALVDDEHETELADARQMLESDQELRNSSLANACAAGSFRAVARFLSDGASPVNSTGDLNHAPLVYVCFSRFLRDPDFAADLVETARVLLTSGADANAGFLLDGNHESCLYGACGVANNAAMAKLLLKHGADPNDGETAYHVAEFEQYDCIRVLFENGMNTASQATVLLRKLDFDDIDGVRFILDLGADPNEQGIWEKAALHQAIMRGRNKEIISLLIERDADVNQQRGDGTSPLQLARQHDRPEIVGLLLEAGARES